jgi:MinD superfamily P-loop ATPase
MTVQVQTKPVPELVVISGKGGTGKTSIVASFACLAEDVALADCDVEAADLDLVLSPGIIRQFQFDSGHVAVIRSDDCIGCGECVEQCRFEAVCANENGTGVTSYWIDALSCEGCGCCVRFCPVEAIDFPLRYSGDWFVSQTRSGPMVHARLRAAQGNSGKLVATVRNEARRLAAEQRKQLIIVDGPPGIGCPVIASITGASMILAVTEPTPSGEQDVARLLQLTRHFGIPAAVCVNKWDLNPSVTERIESRARSFDAAVAGRVRYDETVTRAQLHAEAVVETGGGAAADIRVLWRNLRDVAAEQGISL